MADDKENKNQFTVNDIQSYLSRSMSAEEMNAFEKAVLEDPFLADALEGYSQTSPADAHSALELLRKRIAETVGENIISISRKKVLWWSVAAAAVLILGGGITIYLKNQTNKDIIASNKLTDTSRHEKMEPVLKQVEGNIKSDTIDLEQNSQPATRPPSKGTNAVADRTPVSKAKPREENGLKDSLAFQNRIVSGITPTSKSDPEISEDKTLAHDINKDKQESLNPEKAAAPIKIEQESGIAASRQPDMKRKNANEFLTPHIFTGKLRDLNNNAVPFANIRINNTNNRVYADANGYFRLTSGDSVLNVDIRSVGFQPLQATLSNTNKANNIIMIPDENSLSEVVVKGYATKKSAKADEDEAEPDASPVDGWGNYDAYLANNTVLPRDGINSNIHGEVELSFTVFSSGLMSNFTIEKSLSPANDKEAIRLVKQGPPWQIQKGKKYARVSLTIAF
jgi:hypothetical protein